LILGAGLTGLSTALHLDRLAVETGDATLGDWVLVERDATLGGLTRTEHVDGFLFDHTGHWLHLRHPEMKALVADLMGDRMMEVQRVSRVWSHGALTHYPFQANLYGLPATVVQECLMGAIQSHLDQASGKAKEPVNFQDFCELHFGRGISRHFMIPYNTKLWGVAPTEITAAWCDRFVPKPRLEQVVAGALGASPEQLGYNASFVYPREGGIEALPAAMAARLARAKVRAGVRPVRIDAGRKTMTLSDGAELIYDTLVTSIPLPELLAVVSDLPQPVDEARGWLRCTSLRYVNLGLRKRVLGGIHWLYVPETKYPFYRIGCSSNAVPSLAPAGKSACYVETSNDVVAGDDEISRSVRALLRELGDIDGDDDVEVEAFRHIRYGYVIFDERYFAAKERIFPYLDAQGVRSLGRYGAWVYSSMEDALMDGRRAAWRIAGREEVV